MKGTSLVADERPMLRDIQGPFYVLEDKEMHNDSASFSSDLNHVSHHVI
jgi:hypothetical protein